MSLVLDRGLRKVKETQTTVDQSIEEAARKLLKTSSYLPLRAVRCHCTDGVLTLAGRVPSFYHRQIAQAHVRGVAGVSQIVDELQVQTP
jgi:osmotically-inducible protein OsmY